MLNNMKLHLLGIPHTITDDAHSHCAFTGKIQKFPAMMCPLGYDVIHYGVEGADTMAQEHVTVMDKKEQIVLGGNSGGDLTKFIGENADMRSPLYQEFNRRLRIELFKRVAPNDLVLLPFAFAHAEAIQGLSATFVESGIGYPALYAGVRFKIFESNAWMHWHQGKEGRNGTNYEWVIPNYFDINAWDVNLNPSRNTVVYFGRICEMKGLPIVVEIAKKRKDLHFVICGQGDPTPYLTESNIEYRAPITGRERSALLGNALAVLMPTMYTEPFGGVGVEAMLCGTPLLSVSYGAFTETIEDEVTGFRCHTLGDWLAALAHAPMLDRAYIAERARRLYGFNRVGKMYDRAFKQIADLHGEGWYSSHSQWW
jgi:glycosyltransferase involved in cell wall biosynthesis